MVLQPDTPKTEFGIVQTMLQTAKCEAGYGKILNAKKRRSWPSDFHLIDSRKKQYQLDVDCVQNNGSISFREKV